MSDRPLSIFLIFLRLGLTAFGGPVAHLGYFREAFVTRRRWLSEQRYAELVALCQCLPGPASSQVGLALGLIRGGYRGALAAWAGFTLPSAVLLILLALGANHLTLPEGLLRGLKVVAVAVVAQAVWGMARQFCQGSRRLALMLAATAAMLALPSPLTPLIIILLSGMVGRLVLDAPPPAADEPLDIVIGRRAGLFWLGLFVVLLAGLPALATLIDSPLLEWFERFYRAGSLVFGGGHVVLPLLQAEVVVPGGIDIDRFLVGYGLAQAVPGPLFTFAAFLGASLPDGLGGWTGGALALLAIFLPAFLLVAGALPFWDHWCRLRSLRVALAGINAAVVGLLLAAFFDPVWTSAIHGAADLALALLAFAALVILRLPPWLVVIGCAVMGTALLGR